MSKEGDDGLHTVKCNPNCLLKRYFPHGDDEFEAKLTAVKKHFGHRNLEKKLLAISEKERATSARNMTAEALAITRACAKDPALGLTGDVDKLISEIMAVQVEFEYLNDLLEQLRAQEQTKESFQGGLDQHFPSNINNTMAMPQNPQQVQDFNHQILGHTGDMDKLIGDFMAVQVELNDLLRAQEQTEYFVACFHDLEDLQDVARICPGLSLGPSTTQLQQQNLQDRKSKRSSGGG